MDDLELSFDEVFLGTYQDTQQDHTPQQTTTSKLPISDSTSPMVPGVPHPTTTVTPVLTSSVNRKAWNYTTTLREAFPDADFKDYTESDDTTSLMEWLNLEDSESQDEDTRLAALTRDLLPLQEEDEDAETYLMSGALPNDGEGGSTGSEYQVRSDAVEIERKDSKEGIKNEGKEEGKSIGNDSSQDRDADKREENLRPPSDQEYSDYDSEDDDYDSDEFDETPYGTGIGGGWL